MATRTLEITFIGDAKPITKAFGEVDDAGGKLTAKMSGLSGAFGGVASVAGGVLAAGALGKLAGGLAGAVQAAAEDEQATRRLEQALRNAGGAFDENLAKVNARIDAGAKLAFSDDDVRDSFQKLLAATGDTDEALKRQALAMDFARGAGIPLAQASTLLGKVTAENVEVFKRMGITIGEGASEAEAFAAIQAKFGGQADAYAKSTAGQFEQAKIALSEAKESIGAQLLPVITVLATVLAEKVAPAMATVIGFLQQNPAVAAAAGAIIGTVLVAAFIAWAAAAAAAAVATIAATWPVLAVVAAIALLVAGIVLLVQHWDDLTAKYPALKAAQEAIQAAFQTLIDFIQGTLIPAVLWIWEKGFSPVLGFLQSNWQLIGAIIGAPFLPIILLATDAFGVRTALVNAFQAIVDKIQDGAGWIGHWLNVAGGFFEDFRNMAMGPISAVIGAIEAVINAVSRLPSPGGIVSGVASKIPHLASGGVVTRPTLALIGEAGPEAVVPLGRVGASGGGGGGAVVNIYGSYYGDVGELVRRIDLELKRTGAAGLAG